MEDTKTEKKTSKRNAHEEEKIFNVYVWKKKNSAKRVKEHKARRKGIREKKMKNR